MKNSILIVLLMAVTISFSSCSKHANLSLIKRANTNDNYVAKMKRTKTTAHTNPQEIIIPQETIISQNVISNNQTQTAYSNPNVAMITAATITKEAAGIDQSFYLNNSSTAAYYPEFIKESKANTIANNENRQDFFLYIVLAIFLPPVCVGLWEGGFTTDFWIDLILTICFWLPGAIFALYIILR